MFDRRKLIKAFHLHISLRSHDCEKQARTKLNSRFFLKLETSYELRNRIKNSAFKLFLDDAQTSRGRLRKQKASPGCRFSYCRDGITKPFWSDGSVIQTSLSVLQVSSPRTRSCKTVSLVRLLSISRLFVHTGQIVRRIDEQMEGEIKRRHNYLNGVVDTGEHYRFNA